MLKQPRAKVEMRVGGGNLFDALSYAIFRAEQGVADKNDLFLIEKMASYARFEFQDPNYTPQGEIDFVAIRLCRALHEKACYNRLPESAKQALKVFFTTENYRSRWASENHCLMFRVSRLLAAQFYQDEYMENCQMTAKECCCADKEYVFQFLNFRAKYGWGEFDSLGYAAEIVFILLTLHKYTNDEKLRKMCAMALDIILVDMINDSLG